MPLKNLLILPSTYASLYRDVKRQRKYLNEVIEPILSDAMANNDGSLDEEDFNKIRNYYGFGVPAIVGEGICTLRGKPMTDKERMTSTFQGALTGLYDDFFDKTHLKKDEIRNMMAEPDSIEAISSLQQLFLSFLRGVHINLPDRKLFDHYFDKVYQAQINSKEQESRDIDQERILDITFEKGGYSLLYYRSIFSNPMCEGEENALFHLGGLMQLGNDIFDVYDDSRAGIQTLPIVNGRISEVREYFMDQMDLAISMVAEIITDKKHIRNFLKKFMLGISRCFVCMDQLERLEKKTGGKFRPMKYTRGELVCDMEKPSNILSSLRYFAGYKF